MLLLERYYVSKQFWYSARFTSEPHTNNAFVIIHISISAFVLLDCMFLIDFGLCVGNLQFVIGIYYDHVGKFFSSNEPSWTPEHVRASNIDRSECQPWMMVPICIALIILMGPGGLVIMSASYIYKLSSRAMCSNQKVEFELNPSFFLSLPKCSHTVGQAVLRRCEQVTGKKASSSTPWEILLKYEVDGIISSSSLAVFLFPLRPYFSLSFCFVWLVAIFIRILLPLAIRSSCDKWQKQTI